MTYKTLAGSTLAHIVSLFNTTLEGAIDTGTSLALQFLGVLGTKCG